MNATHQLPGGHRRVILPERMHYSNIPSSVKEEWNSLTESVKQMKHHRVFSMVDSVDSLRVFMQWHVYAVWDFMSLAKRLQNDLTNTSVPWFPPRNRKAARLINEIILGEETDEAPSGEHLSHFEMYLIGMREVGAPTDAIESFIRHIRYGIPVERALQRIQVPEAIRAFVMSTMQMACHGKTQEALGSFFFGREDVLPQMFQYLLDSWMVDPRRAPMFVYYLQRHIELDSGSHGPAVEAIILDMLGDREDEWRCMLKAGRNTVEKRIRMWDALAQALEAAKRPASIAPALSSGAGQHAPFIHH